MPKQKKPSRKKNYLPILFLLIIAGVFAALAFTVLFPLTRVTIAGETRYSPQNFMNAMRLDEQNLNLLRADVDELIAMAELALPWVRVTGFTRQPPNTLRLQVEELIPAFVQQQDGQWWLIAENGRLLDRVESSPEDVFHLRGMELLEPEPGQNARWEHAFTRPSDLQDLIDALRGSALFPYITGLRVSGYTTPDVIYQDRIRIRFGAVSPTGAQEGDCLRGQFQLAEHVLAQLNAQNPNYRGVLDLGVAGQVPFSPMWGEWEP
jgi:hypothetical protein